MAKLAVLAALFVALFAVASAHTTVVTTSVVDDEENPAQSCQREVQEMRMRHCMQWMQTRGPFLRSEVANPQYGEEHLDECCDELRSVSRQCRCDAIRRMMKRAQQEYGMEEEMMRQKAQSLPRMCRMRSPTECRFTDVFA